MKGDILFVAVSTQNRDLDHFFHFLVEEQDLSSRLDEVLPGLGAAILGPIGQHHLAPGSISSEGLKDNKHNVELECDLLW